MRTLAAMLMLAGFGGIATAEPVPLPTPRPPIAKQPPPPVWAPRPDRHDPVSFRDAAGPDFKTEETTSEPSDCRLRLEKVASIEAMPRLVGPGACGGGDIVRLDAVLLASGKRIAVKPASYLRCPMAEQLALWVRDDTAPLVATNGAELTAVETVDDFDCRGRNGKSTGKVSEHGKADANDVRGFTLADGDTVKPTDIHLPKALRENLRRSACDRFTTVLGPGSDGYHEEHIHLDLAERHSGYRICQWDVREPPPVAEQPKPVEPAKPQEKSEAKTEENSADAGPVATLEPTPAPKLAPIRRPASIPEPPRVQLANLAVPLPRPRPVHAATERVRKVHHRRKTRGGLHFPFSLFQ
jgi:hypothetical protein